VLLEYAGEEGASLTAVAEGAVWSQYPLQPLAPGVLTPFSFSVLSELFSRAWYVYYDRLGFAPAPRTRLLRWRQGRAYLNLSVSARLEAAQAGVEPTTIRIDGQLHPLAVVEKAGFLAGFRLGRSRRRIEDQFAHLERHIEEITRRAYTWYLKTQELRWTQAEVLQIMEEIETVGVDSMAAYFAARHNLERLYNRLALATSTSTPFPANLASINNALCEVNGLVETDMAHALAALSEIVGKYPSAVAWLKTGIYDHWQDTLTDEPVRAGLRDFLAAYGHRGLGEGEMAHPRWQEDAAPIFQSLLACVQGKVKLPVKTAAAGGVQPAHDQLFSATGDKKRTQQALDEMRRLQTIQSNALHALAYIWAGTRRWAQAAAKEAMVDRRLSAVEDVFFYELEEIKEMMTGEWNVSDLDTIRAACAERKTEYAAWQKLHPGEMLLNDIELHSTHSGLPAVSGRAAGPFHRWENSRFNGSQAAIVGAAALDSGWSLALPVAAGFVAAGGTPLDPVATAARAWPLPTIVGLGQQYWALVEGAQTTVDGDTIAIEQ
jgi:pyruvate,water dikinase